MPSLQYSVLSLQDMSDKKSPPQKEKLFVRTQLDGKPPKRKFTVSDSPPHDEDDRKATPKRKKTLNSEMSPTQGSGIPFSKAPTSGITSPRAGPLSERQQLLFLMRMTDDSQDSTSKPTSPQPSVPPLKKTPGDKKVHKRNERGETPLHIAAIKGDVKQTKKLIKAGADVNVADFAGWTPLHEASNRGFLLVARQLMKAGANVNVQGLENDTPLHDAAGNDHIQVVELLLKHGANPLQPNLKGKKPVDVAGSPEMVKLLRKEIIASSSDSSSLDDIRSPTSPESNSSLKEEDFRSTDTDEFMPRVSKPENNNLTSGPSSRRQILPKSPSEKLSSPRMILKIHRDEISDKPTDFTSYSVRVETSENKHFQQSPTDSPVSSVDSELYDPQLDGSKNKYKPGQESESTAEPNQAQPSSSSHSSFKSRNMSSFSSAFGDTDDFEMDGFNRLSNLEPDSQTPVDTTCSSGPKYHLKMMETQRFSPRVEEFSDSESKDSFRLRSRSAGDRTHIPSVDSNHSRLKEVVDSVLSSESINTTNNSSVVSTCTKTGSNDSVVTNSSSTLLDRSFPQISSTFSRKNSASGYTSTGLLNTNNGNDTVSAAVPPSGIKWELRSMASPKSEDGSNSVKSEGTRAASPSRHESKEPKSSPKMERDRESRDSRPCSPKVPPLKIIIPPKTPTTLSQDPESAKVQMSKSLPYVLNPTQEQEGNVSSSVTTSVFVAESSVPTQEMGRAASPSSSRPSSRGSNAPSRDGDKSCLKETKEKENQEDKNKSSSDPECLGDSTSSEQNLEKEKEVKEKENSSKTKEQEKDSGKEKGQEDEKEKEVSQRPTRTLRSHTQALQQQEKQKQQSQQQQQQTSKDKEKVNTNKEKESSEKDDASSIVSKSKGDDDDNNIHPRKRKLRPKPDSAQPVAEPPVPVSQVSYEKPPNPFDMFLTIRRQINMQQSNLTVVRPKAPQGFKDYLMVSSSYVLQGNSASTLSVPMLSPPNSVSGKMRELFIEQERIRYKLRLQHLTEREKLIISLEQETVREHGRAARALANQSLPLSVCTVLRNEEIYNSIDPDQDEKEKNVRTRYNGRQFLSWLKDLDDKYEKIKEKLLLRHHHEAETLYAVQKLDWEWKMKELGLCDHNTTPVIEELQVPMVQVNDEFELLPS